MEYTRAMPQYGYVLSGIKQDELSNLAEHHYLVTFVAWQLALMVNKKGADVNVAKVLEFSLIHDLGELFGGDIAMPYAKANPEARTAAKKFEAENHKFLATYFGDHQEYFQKISDEIMDAQSDEAIISKLADYIEVTQYKQYMKLLDASDVKMIEPKLIEKVEKMSNEVAREELKTFISQWVNEVPLMKTVSQQMLEG